MSSWKGMRANNFLLSIQSRMFLKDNAQIMIYNNEDLTGNTLEARIYLSLNAQRIELEHVIAKNFG